MNSPKYDSRNDSCNDQTSDLRGKLKTSLQSARNGIHLGHGSNPKESHQDTCQGKEDGKGTPFFPHPMENVVHRTTRNMTIVILGPVANGQQTFCILGRHPKEGRHPHPKEGTWTSCLNSCRYSDNISCPNCRRQGCCQGSEARDIPFSLIFCKNEPKGLG